MTKRAIYSIAVLMFMCCSSILGQSIYSTVTYKIEIFQAGFIPRYNSSWQITPDSIVAKIVENHIISIYSVAISPKESQNIIDSLKKIELAKIAIENTNNSAPDDAGEFDFRISLNQQERKFHVYQTKIEKVFKLVAFINGLFPEKFKIGYNDKYFAN